MKRIFNKIREWFKPRIEPKFVTSTSSEIPTPKESQRDKLTREYRQYRKAMRKRGETPASINNWQRSKHPLHSIHFGTFNPIASIPVLYRKNKNTVLRIA